MLHSFYVARPQGYATRYKKKLPPDGKAVVNKYLDMMFNVLLPTFRLTRTSPPSSSYKNYCFTYVFFSSSKCG